MSHSKHISLFAAFAINSTPLVPLIPNQWVSLLRPVLAAVPLQSHTVTVSFRAESTASRSDPEAEGCQYSFQATLQIYIYTAWQWENYGVTQFNIQ